ncbi:Cyclin [Macleaya cordata]|uniref:Cyclin n=1 Tax=Macleaya cordata TaxID=56857 RepID=A0A200R986_MACCD|nr:Cyclin [Macleaya cordata]OVA19246.1 Cyclin [Macleaya cordata]
MSLSCSDCFSDLLCGEDVGTCLDEDLSAYSPDLVTFPVDIEEYVSELVEEEGDQYYVQAAAGFDYDLANNKFDHHHDQHSEESVLDHASSARQDSVAWILKVCTFFRFHPLTAYLSVNYMDRFLSARRLPKANGWPLQLLSVACLSLAAKMEELRVPSLFDIQVVKSTSNKCYFESKAIRRMEFLVLSTLDWRLRSITPFHFIDFFANKVDSSSSRTFLKFLVSQATQIILATMRDLNLLNYPPSSMAAAAILCAANEIPNLSFINPGRSVQWCNGLSKGKIMSCYKLMQEVVHQRKPPKVLRPQLRVATTQSWVNSIDSSPSFSSSFSSLPFIKRRKLNNTLWVGDDDIWVGDDDMDNKH